MSAEDAFLTCLFTLKLQVVWVSGIIWRMHRNHPKLNFELFIWYDVVSRYFRISISWSFDFCPRAISWRNLFPRVFPTVLLDSSCRPQGRKSRTVNTNHSLRLVTRPCWMTTSCKSIDFVLQCISRIETLGVGSSNVFVSYKYQYWLVSSITLRFFGVMLTNNFYVPNW